MNKVYIIGRDEIPEQFRLSEGEKLTLDLVALPGTVKDLALRVDIDGPDCELDIAGVYLCSGNDELKLKILISHNSGHSISRQLIKGLADDSSKVLFNGLIYIAQDAQKTEAYQGSHGILLSSAAKIEAQPQLEIYADDVVCSHGCTSGYLNEDEEFYMRSRGIPKEEAHRLQKIAFLAPVLRRLPEELVKEVYDNIS